MTKEIYDLKVPVCKFSVQFRALTVNVKTHPSHDIIAMLPTSFVMISSVFLVKTVVKWSVYPAPVYMYELWLIIVSQFEYHLFKNPDF